MFQVLVVGAIAALLLSKSDTIKSKIKPNNLNDTPTPTPTPPPTNNRTLVPTYKNLAKDLIDSHGMNTTSWVSNIKIHSALNGFSIGSDENKVILTDNENVKLVLNNGNKTIDLKSTDTNSAISHMIKIVRSDKYSKNEQQNIEKLINLLLKYKNSYVFIKYIKH